VSSSGKTLLGITVIVLVVTAAVTGLYMLGPPREERDRKLYTMRVAHLREAARAVDRYWAIRDTLPPSLEALSKERGISLTLLDPQTGRPYQYRVLEGTAYELCANFSRDDSEDNRATLSPEIGSDRYPPFWSHGAGRHCYRLEPQKQP
jgi:hypothetical protein